MQWQLGVELDCIRLSTRCHWQRARAIVASSPKRSNRPRSDRQRCDHPMPAYNATSVTDAPAELGAWSPERTRRDVLAVVGCVYSRANLHQGIRARPRQFLKRGPDPPGSRNRALRLKILVPPPHQMRAPICGCPIFFPMFHPFRWLGPEPTRAARWVTQAGSRFCP